MRVKPSVGYQKEDIRINGNRLGILDVNNRGNDIMIIKVKYSQGRVRMQWDIHSWAYYG